MQDTKIWACLCKYYQSIEAKKPIFFCISVRHVVFFFKVQCDLKLKYTVSPQGFKTVSLTSMELQMLTSSCIKLQTVHHIPLSINKEGRVTVFILSNIILCFLQTSFKLKIFMSAYEAVLFTASVCLAFIGNLELSHNVPRNEVIINNWEN